MALTCNEHECARFRISLTYGLRHNSCRLGGRAELIRLRRFAFLGQPPIQVVALNGFVTSVGTFGRDRVTEVLLSARGMGGEWRSLEKGGQVNRTACQLRARAGLIAVWRRSASNETAELRRDTLPCGDRFRPAGILPTTSSPQRAGA